MVLSGREKLLYSINPQENELNNAEDLIWNQIAFVKNDCTMHENLKKKISDEKLGVAWE